MKVFFVLCVLFSIPSVSLAQDRNDEVLRQLTELQKSISSLHEKMTTRVEKVETSTAEIKKDFDDLRNEITRLQSQISDVQKSTTLLAKIDKVPTRSVPKTEIEQPLPHKIPENRIEQTERGPIEYVPVPKNYKLTQTKSMGTIIFSSTYSFPVQVTCNGETFTLHSGDQRNIEVPAGTYTYMVSGAHAGMQTRTIAVGDVQRIDVHNKTVQQQQYYYSTQYYCPPPVYYNPCWRR